MKEICLKRKSQSNDVKRFFFTKVHFDEASHKEHLIVGEDIDRLFGEFSTSRQFQIKLLKNTLSAATEVKSAVEVRILYKNNTKIFLSEF